MANLGTLWFGADIDLTELKRKVNQGNQSILDTLKMSYDSQSYQQMVSKLRSQLANETFDIKISANTQGIGQNIRQQLGRNSGLTGGLDGLNEKIKAQTIAVNALMARLQQLHAQERSLKDSGQLLSLSSLRPQIAATRQELALEKQTLADFIAQRTAMRNAAQDTLLNLRREAAEHKNTATIARDAAREKTAAVRRLNSDHVRLNTTLANGVHVSKQLGSALSSVFAIHAAREFLGNVIEIGGQLERQRISIGAILGDSVKANHLFEQIKDLALKSPFGVVELDQYTKQLSAYGFKYNELFDMTKRLADISAGAGTDIGRLTLALGHVRSATYLTGITLRQFSMNNIPMLKMLADYYTELEGKIVSTSEVQKRISKRQVSYQDVTEQIKRLTDEGGMFYNMQEKISESLSAKFKNLKDAMDIMYGEIAESSMGSFMKNIATTLTAATRHWQEIAAMVTVAGLAFMASKLRIGFNTVAMQGNTAATIRNIMATKNLEANNLRAAASYRTLTVAEKRKIITANQLTAADISAAMATNNLTKDEVLNAIALKKVSAEETEVLVKMKLITAEEARQAMATNALTARWQVFAGKLKTAFAGIGPGTLATLGLMVGAELYTSISSWNERIDSKAKEIQDVVKSRIVDLQKQQKVLQDDGKPKDNATLKARVDDMKQVLANSEAYTKTLDGQLAKTSDINKQYDILADAIDKTVEKNSASVDVQDDVAKMIKASSTEMMSFRDLMLNPNRDIGDLFNYMFNDSISKNMEQTLSAYADLRKVIDTAWEYKDAIKGVIDEMVESGEISAGFSEQLKDAPFEEQIQLLATSGYWDKIVAKVSEQKAGFSEYAKNIKEASQGIADKWNEIAEDDIPKMLMKFSEGRFKDEKELREWALNNIDDFKTMLDGINDQLDIKEPAIRKRLKRLFYEYVRFSEWSAGLGEGAAALGNVVGNIMGDEALKKILEENELADLKDGNADTAGKDGNKKKDKQLEEAKTRFDRIKSFLSEYKKYIQQYDRKKSISLLENLFPELKGQGSKIVDNYMEVLDDLRNSLPATTEARKKFLTDIDTTKADTALERDSEAMKKNVKDMEEYVKRVDSQWKLYRDVMKKTGNRDLAKLAFGNDVLFDKVSRTMLGEINAKIAERGIMPVAFQWDMSESELKETLVDANGIVQQDLVKLVQEYLKIVRKNWTDAFNEMASAMEKLMTTEDKILKAERELAELREKYGKDDPRTIAKERELGHLQVEAFEQSEPYLRFYSGIFAMTADEAEKVGAKIKENLVDQLAKGDINADKYLKSIKNVDQQLEKMRGVRSDALTLLTGGYRGLMEKRGNQYESQAANAATRIKKAEEALTKARLEGDETAKDKAETEKATAQNELAVAQKKMGWTQESLKQANEVLAVMELVSGAIDGMKQAAQQLSDMFDALGHEHSANTWSDIADTIGAIGSPVSAATNALKSAMSGDVGGVISNTVGIFTSPITAFAKLHDKKQQRKIEDSEKKVKSLTIAYGNLESAMEKALGGIYTSGGYDEMLANLKEQREELAKQYAAESDKKKSDASKLEDYEQQIREMDEQIKDFALDMAKTLYDIDLQSWASELTEAVVSAWENGEDAVEAYRDKVKDIMKDLTTNILTKKVMEKAFETLGVDKLIAGMMDASSGKLDETAIPRLAEALGKAGNLTVDAITRTLDSMEAQGYIGKDKSSKSSTSSSIKSITEETADLLASYINAIRSDVSVQRMDISLIRVAVENLAGRSLLTQTQENNLQNIADYTLRTAEASEAVLSILNGARTDKSRGLYIR